MWADYELLWGWGADDAWALRRWRVCLKKMGLGVGRDVIMGSQRGFAFRGKPGVWRLGHAWVPGQIKAVTALAEYT